jgi:hypothetical protein
MTVKLRRGRVMATRHCVSARHHISTSLLSELSGWDGKELPGKSEEGEDIPFNLLFSPRNPTSFSELLRTRVTIMA